MFLSLFDLSDSKEIKDQEMNVFMSQCKQSILSPVVFMCLYQSTATELSHSVATVLRPLICVGFVRGSSVCAADSVAVTGSIV